MRSTYGANCWYVRFSPIFSTPRCRYPITHSVPMTFSPSSLRITRSTPCVEGCCGPMLSTSSVESRKVVSGMEWIRPRLLRHLKGDQYHYHVRGERVKPNSCRWIV